MNILTKVVYTSDLTLVILAWTGDELSCGQACDWCTHRRMDRQTDPGNENTLRPKLALVKDKTFAWQQKVNSLAPARFEINHNNMNLISVNDGYGKSC